MTAQATDFARAAGAVMLTILAVACGLGTDLDEYAAGGTGAASDAQAEPDSQGAGGSPDASAEGASGAAGAAGEGGSAGMGGQGGTAGTAGVAGDAALDQLAEADADNPLDANGLDADGPEADAGPACKGGNVASMVVLPGGQAIDSTEVTKCQYKAWLDSGLPKSASKYTYCSTKTSFTPDAPWPPTQTTQDEPVTFVDICDAHAYCDAVGKVLCGRPGGGTSPYGYPDNADPTKSLWSYACTSGGVNAFPYGAAHQPGVCNDQSASAGKLAGVATFAGCQAPAPYHGVYDLTGNAEEWEDSCDVAGDWCRARGGSFWTTDPATHAACAASTGRTPLDRDEATGFRCCKLPGDSGT